jgi:hypothetical protein
MDNLVFLFEQIKMWSGGAVNIVDWMRTDPTFNQIIDALGLTSYIQASLQNFDFHGAVPPTGYWTCWWYTLQQVGLMYSVLWVGFLVAKSSFPAFMKLLGIFNAILQLVVSLLLFQRQKAIVDFVNSLGHKTDNLERAVKVDDEDEPLVPAATGGEPVRWTRESGGGATEKKPRWETLKPVETSFSYTPLPQDDDDDLTPR